MSNRNVLQEREFQDLISKLNNADGYFIGITTLKDGVNHHSILTDTYPFADLLRSLKKIKDLCVEELEKDLNTIPIPQRAEGRSIPIRNMPSVPEEITQGLKLEAVIEAGAPEEVIERDGSSKNS